MRKIAGIPPILLGAILIGVGIAAAVFTYVYTVKPTVQRPTSEQATKFFNVEPGDTFTMTKWLDLALPGSYDLKYKLTGDTNDNLENESATISLDLDDDRFIDAGEPVKTINKLGGTVTFTQISGQIRQKIEISATARDRAHVATTYSGTDQDPAFSTVTTTLKVSMEPTKAA